MTSAHPVSGSRSAAAGASRARVVRRALDVASAVVTCGLLGGLVFRLLTRWAPEHDLVFVALDAGMLVFFVAEVVLRFVFAERRPGHLRARWFDLIVLVPLVQTALGRATAAKWYLVRQVAALAAAVTRTRGAQRLATLLWLHPARLMVSSFGVAALLGALLLSTRWASTAEPLHPVDALFTSTSALCVTGLTVVDTGTRFTLFGQAVILVLIQLGGLGIMTFSVSLVLLLGRSVSKSQAVVMQDMLDQESVRDVLTLVRFLLVATVLIEGAGAAALFACSSGREGLSAAHAPSLAWTSVFHSISAFCNAGFSLYRDNFESWKSHVGANLSLAGLIILGGLGFPVLRDLARQGFRRQSSDGRAPGLQMQTKVVLAASAVLILGGAGLFYLLEAPRTLAQQPTGTRVLASFFQSVTARTAGFNTVDIGQVGNAGLLVLMGLMFIGASPGSTGGGIKTTTAAVVWAATWAALRGRSRVELFRRSVPRSVIRRAIALMTVSTLLLAGMGLALMSVEDQPFGTLAFELVSAFGTVGLSAGATAKLTVAGRLIITAVMFIGRVGPLTLAFLFVSDSGEAHYTYPEERVMIG
jgi:trk system potassium uptake protein